MPKSTSKPKTTSNMPSDVMAFKQQRELFRSATVLLVGILAAMAFLLVIGVQRPSESFRNFFNASVVLLGLSMCVYVVGTMFAKTEKAIKAFKMIHQVVFLLGVVAISVFTLVAAHIFFAPAPVQQSVPTQSSEEAPATTSEQPSSTPQ